MLISTPFGSAAPEATLQLWPPGYPAAIALVARLTALEPATAGLWLSRLSLGALPFVVFWALRPVVDWRIAACAGVLAFSSPGLMPNASLAFTDALYALVATLSAGLLLRALQTRALSSFAAAGFFAAMAMTVRNAAIALLAAEACCLVAILAGGGRRRWRDLFRIIAAWCAGAAPLLAALAYWNLVVLKTVAPYQMPPSTVGFRQNAARMLWSYVYDVLPYLPLNDLIARLYLGPVVQFTALLCGVLAIGIHKLRAGAPQGYLLGSRLIKSTRL
jgi:hypothetical protein